MTEGIVFSPHIAILLVKTALKDELVPLMSKSEDVFIAWTEKLVEVTEVLSLGFAQHPHKVEVPTDVVEARHIYHTRWTALNCGKT